MKLLFLGDTAGTGFGTVTRELGRELIAAGIDVRFMSLNEKENLVGWSAGTDAEWMAGRVATLDKADGWLNLSDPELLQGRIGGMWTGSLFEDGWAPDAGLILGDVGSLEMSGVLDLIPDGFPVWHYVPIEGVWLPPTWAGVWQKTQPVACSEFGADQIATIAGHRPPVIYHGVDRETFYPVSAKRPIVMRKGSDLTVLRSREDCRRLLGWPKDDVILFRADRFMPRKAMGAMFRAVAPVLAKHKNVRLIWHCRTNDHGGSMIRLWSHYWGTGLSERMQSTGAHDLAGGVDRKVLAAMYNASDIYVSTSAEGFGLTIAEALACGIPAVGLAYSSVPEVIGAAGITVPWWPLDNIYGCLWATPVEPAYTAAVESLVTDTARRMVLGAKGPYQVEKFSWQRTAVEQWLPLLTAGIREAVAA